MHTSEDPQMRLLLMAGTFGKWMQRDFPTNPIIADSEARQQVAEWIATFFDAQIKIAVEETKKSQPHFTMTEKEGIKKGLEYLLAGLIDTPLAGQSMPGEARETYADRARVYVANMRRKVDQL